MKVSVIGLGGIGYSWAVLLASIDYKVVGIDINPNVIKNPRADKSVRELFAKHENKIKKNLKLTTNYKEIKDCELIFCTVNAGFDDQTRQLNLKPVEAVLETTNKMFKKPPTIIVITTLPYGASKILSRICDYAVVPQMVAQGHYVYGYINPPFIIIGSTSKKAEKDAKSFYEEFFKRLKIKQPPTYFTDPRTVEMTKLVANAFLSMKLVFANTINTLCEPENIDARLILKAMGNDPRIGYGFLTAYYAYGGECFPKDMKALITTCKEIATKGKMKPAELFEVIEALNNERVFSPINVLQDKDLLDKSTKIAILGLAYKAGISDTRSSPSMILVDELRNEGYTIDSYDPNLPGQKKLDSILKTSDVVIVTTAEKEFQELNLNSKCKAVLDYANIVDSKSIPKNVSFFKAGVGWLKKS